MNLSPRAMTTELDDDQRLRFGADGEIVLERRRGHKRSGEEEGDDTEREDEGVNHALPPPSQQGQPNPANPTTVAANDFPPVFTSPQLSIPELYGPQAMGPPPVPARAFAGMPRRQLRPTMSAPVGRLGSEQGGLRGFGMQVDADDEDGFDVGDWTADQEGEGAADVTGWAKSDAF